MNRRLFLRLLGLGSAVAASAPATLFAGNPERAADAILHGPGITEYADYVNFSSFAITSTMDKDLLSAANELGEIESKRINALCERGYPVASDLGISDV